MRLRYFTVLFLSVLVPASVRAAEPCSARAEQPVLLSGDKPDSISVEISGPSCAEATLTVRIVARSGATLYQRSTPLARFYSVSGEGPYIEAPSIESADRLAREIVSSHESRKVADLLPYFTGEQDDGISIRRFAVPEATALRLRHQPLFTLTTAWEAWDELAFDPETSRVVLVAEGWM